MLDQSSTLYQNRLGYYTVGDQIYRNRFLAMSAAKKQSAKTTWHFNREVYSNINWETPIQTPLNELYRLRAQQLRNSYDYLILNFSGGIDSVTVLHSFIDNGIFLDEILIQLPSNFRPNAHDHSNANYWSEIEYQAKPHLKKYQHLIDPRTKIRFQDICEPVNKIFSNEHWADIIQPHCNLTVPGFARIVSQFYDPDVLELAMKGVRVGRIYGSEKPKIRYIVGRYVAYFNDLGIYMHSAPGTTAESQALFSYHNVEPFYWTPYLPEIVVKQCQVIVSKVMTDPVYRQMFHAALQKKAGWYSFEKLIAPVIYDRADEILWSTEKVTEFTVRKTDDWFWQGAETNKRTNFLELIKWYDTQVDSSEFLEGTVLSGATPKESGYYLIASEKKEITHV
jgi:hypothetical protein